MEIKIEEGELPLPWIKVHGVFTGKIDSYKESSEEGKSPYVEFLIVGDNGKHTLKMYLSEKARKKLREFWYFVKGEDIAGNFNTDRFKEVVGVEVAYKLVPEIDESSGRVYYKTPWSDFIRLPEHKDTLVFSDAEKKLIAEAEKIAKTVSTEEKKEEADQELPF